MQSADSKKSLSFIDINAISPVYCNPRKAWKELLDSLDNIFKTFVKSEIDPEEIRAILNLDEKNKNNIPDVASIDFIISIINRYILEYKISDATAIFLEFKRHAAIYLFSIGSQEKAIELLKEITTVTSDSTNTLNPDINLTCIRDCVRLNQAAIHFWLGDFDESLQLLEKVVSYYESTNEELYLIKMVNFASVAFTYLAWIYTKRSEYEDAERAFFHALKILGLVKRYSRHNLKDENFINIKEKKIFIYDQLINFYTFTRQLDLCEQPLMEILKIMDKENFSYDVDLKPANHVYYYITAIFYCIKQSKMDFAKALQYTFNLVTIIYNNADSFELIPRCFFQKIFYMIELVHINNDQLSYDKNKVNKTKRRGIHETEDESREVDLCSKIYDYFDEIIANYDEEKVLSLNIEGGSLADNLITLSSFSEYVQNEDFAEFNFIRDIKKKNDDSLLKNYSMEFEINELYLVKFVTERMLFKFANIITDLVDCKGIEKNSIVLEGLNGFFLVENDELVLFSIHRFMVRDGAYNLYPDIKINEEEDIKEDFGDKKLETLKVIKIKNLEYKFAPLYYKRITFRLNKDAKNFNFSNYFSMINLLYSKKLYYPCVSLLALFIEEVSAISRTLYKEALTHQKTECFLHLFEFLLFLQVYILMSLKNYDRALFELLRIEAPINDLGYLLYKILLGICYGHCLYYDLAIVTLCEAFYFLDPFVAQYVVVSEEDQQLNKKKNPDFKKKVSPETYLTEMRVFYSFIRATIKGVMDLNDAHNGGESKINICYRCKIQAESIKTYCLHCNKVKYCSPQCMKKNKQLHDLMCRIYLEQYPIINETCKGMRDNYENVKNLEKRKKKK